MSFSKEWEINYKLGKHNSIWPWSDIVSLVHRFKSHDNRYQRVLEIGCGAGANIKFFNEIGIEYFGIDGSKTIISKLKGKYPNIASNFSVCDFTETLHFKGPFDLIIDRASLTHNSDKKIRETLSNINRLLRDKGIFISVDWFSTSHYGYKSGEAGPDQYTRCNFKEGSLSGTGRAHFSDKANLFDLFNNWEILYLQHKKCDEHIPEDKFNPAFWNIVARK